MAAVVLDESNFPQASGVLTANGANLGAAGLQSKGAVTSDTSLVANTTVSAQGLVMTNSVYSQSPASSAASLFIPAEPNGFTIGRNFTWTAPPPGQTTWRWVGSAGTPGRSVLSGPPGFTAFDSASVYTLTRFYLGGATALGLLCIVGVDANQLIIESRSPVDSSLVTADTGSYTWICFNPNWS